MLKVLVFVPGYDEAWDCKDEEDQIQIFKDLCYIYGCPVTTPEEIHRGKQSIPAGDGYKVGECYIEMLGRVPVMSALEERIKAEEIAKTKQCGVIDCTNQATHTWSGHPTCDACGSPGRIKRTIPNIIG